MFAKHEFFKVVHFWLLNRHRALKRFASFSSKFIRYWYGIWSIHVQIVHQKWISTDHKKEMLNAYFYPSMYLYSSAHIAHALPMTIKYVWEKGKYHYLWYIQHTQYIICMPTLLHVHTKIASCMPSKMKLSHYQNNIINTSTQLP